MMGLNEIDLIRDLHPQFPDLGDLEGHVTDTTAQSVHALLIRAVFYAIRQQIQALAAPKRRSGFRAQTDSCSSVLD